MSTHSLSEEERAERNARLQKIWAKDAPGYDKKIGWFERRIFGDDNRVWACSRARGDVLEVAVGTGLNLPAYPAETKVTGLDLSPAMLDVARRRAVELGVDVDLREGDAHELPFGDESFDTVVCTFSLCNIPDVDRAIGEMKRVLKPGGRLVLVDHIRSSVKPVYWLQKVVEFASLRFEGDHMTRRPLGSVKQAGFEIEERKRFRWGIVERVMATKPQSGSSR